MLSFRGPLAVALMGAVGVNAAGHGVTTNPVCTAHPKGEYVGAKTTVLGVADANLGIAGAAEKCEDSKTGLIPDHLVNKDEMCVKLISTGKSRSMCCTGASATANESNLGGFKHESKAGNCAQADYDAAATTPAGTAAAAAAAALATAAAPASSASSLGAAAGAVIALAGALLF